MKGRKTKRNAGSGKAKKAAARARKKKATRSRRAPRAKVAAAKRVRRNRRPARAKVAARRRTVPRVAKRRAPRTRNAFGLDRFVGRKPRVTSESWTRAGEKRRASALQKAGVPKKLLPAYTGDSWKDLQALDPGFVSKVMRGLNPGRGKYFQFHGAFTKKSAAATKEQSTKGGFILPRWIGRDHRYVVLSPLGGAKNARRRARRNPDGEERAGEKYAMFHGRGAKEVVTVEQLAPKDLFSLGGLVSLRMGQNDYQIQWPKSERPMLAGDVEAEQLYIVGGDQCLGDTLLRDMGVSTNVDVVDLGEIAQIEYFTRKDFDNFQPIVYFHSFGEEDAKKNPRQVRRPRLLYSRRYKKLMLAGGAYKIKRDGIIN